MATQFDIKPQDGASFRRFLASQLFHTPPYPAKSFEGQTVIITGSNTGLGLEAARHVFRLGCAKLILAVRTISKGEAAKEDIVRSVKKRSDGATTIDVWPLDLSKTESTLKFAERVNSELGRLDVVIENAGISATKHNTSEGVEDTIQVNVLSTFLLALLVLPKLMETKSRFPGSEPHLTVVSSEVHHWTKFKEASSADLYAALNSEKGFEPQDRYMVSKLMEVLFLREFVSRLEQSPAFKASSVTINMVNPGLCRTELMRDIPVLLQIVGWVFMRILARSGEVGSRTLVLAASAPASTHGKFMSNGEIEKVEPWIYTDMGKKVQKKVYEETMAILRTRKAGLGNDLGV